MQMDHSLDDLHEKLEQLVNRSQSTLSEAHRRSIADKFANKSLQELNEIACNLETNTEL
jgi:hypothetical protein